MLWLYCGIPQKLQEHVHSYIYKTDVRLRLFELSDVLWSLRGRGGEGEAGRKESPTRLRKAGLAGKNGVRFDKFGMFDGRTLLPFYGIESDKLVSW